MALTNITHSTDSYFAVCLVLRSTVGCFPITMHLDFVLKDEIIAWKVAESQLTYAQQRNVLMCRLSTSVDRRAWELNSSARPRVWMERYGIMTRPTNPADSIPLKNNSYLLSLYLRYFHVLSIMSGRIPALNFLHKSLNLLVRGRLILATTRGVKGPKKIWGHHLGRLAEGYRRCRGAHRHGDTLICVF